MAFSLDRFYRLNRKAIIWIILFGLIYLMRDAFTLIFLTFILSFFAFQISKYLSTRFGLRWTYSVILIFAVLLGGYIFAVWPILRSVGAQVGSMQAKLPGYQTKLNEWRDFYSEKYPNIANLLGLNVESSRLNEYDIVKWSDFYAKLAREGAPTTPPNPSRRIMEFLPDEPEQLIREAAEKLNAQSEAKTETADAKPRTGKDEVEAPLEKSELVSVIEPAAFRDATGRREEATTATQAVIAQPERPATPDEEFGQHPQREAQIIDAINANVVSARNFYSPVYFQGVEFAGIVSQHRAQGAANISNREIEKFNRQLLEASFPEVLVKRRYVAEEKINTLIEEYRSRLQGTMPTVAGRLLDFFATSLLAILFSFLILLDYERLSKMVQSLGSSKLSDFYEEAGQPVVKFALSVGRGFQAMVVIAFFTTAFLTTLLVILGIPSIALLAMIIFFTSLVPVVGIVMQVIPIMIVALNENGPQGALWAFAATMLVHLLVGYGLTPYIFGRQFKLNLVFVIFILFLANRFGGIWGMILAVPVANYLLRDVFKVPLTYEKEAPEPPIELAMEPEAALAETTTEPPPSPAATPLRKSPIPKSVAPRPRRIKNDPASE